ncbi:Plant transposon protein [Fragilaria crotonensis]|nr:Plant transposon protein [Fragilaria crotonensis]
MTSRTFANLHEEVHGVQGMLGCLTVCMLDGRSVQGHGSQASFKSGKESDGLTVMLKVLADHHLWFWNASFGYAGSLTDTIFLNLSPLLWELLVDGSFVKLENKSADIVTFQGAGGSFQQSFAMVDGIYPLYSRFVKRRQVPVTDSDKSLLHFLAGMRQKG